MMRTTYTVRAESALIAAAEHFDGESGAVTLAIDAAGSAGLILPPAFQNLGNLNPAALAADATQLAGEPANDLPQAGAAMLSPFLQTLSDRSSELDKSSPQRMGEIPSPRPAQSSGLGDVG